MDGVCIYRVGCLPDKEMWSQTAEEIRGRAPLCRQAGSGLSTRQSEQTLIFFKFVTSTGYSWYYLLTHVS